MKKTYLLTIITLATLVNSHAMVKKQKHTPNKTKKIDIQNNIKLIRKFVFANLDEHLVHFKSLEALRQSNNPEDKEQLIAIQKIIDPNIVPILYTMQRQNMPDKLWDKYFPF